MGDRGEGGLHFREDFPQIGFVQEGVGCPYGGFPHIQQTAAQSGGPFLRLADEAPFQSGMDPAKEGLMSGFGKMNAVKQQLHTPISCVRKCQIQLLRQRTVELCQFAGF